MCAGTCQLLMRTINRGTGNAIDLWFRTVMHCDRNSKYSSSWQAEGALVAVVRAEDRRMTYARDGYFFQITPPRSGSLT